MPNSDFSKQLATIDPTQAGALTQLLQLVKDVQINDKTDPRINDVRQKVNVAKPYHERRLKALVSTMPPTKPVSTTDTGIVSEEQAVKLEQVRELSNDIEELVENINQLKRLKTDITTQQMAVKDQAELAEIWQTAIGRIDDWLDRSIQLSPGSKPIILLDARGELQKLVTTFQDNPIGAGGTRLWDHPERLAKFLERLEQIEPQPMTLIQNARMLIQDKALDLDHLKQLVETKQEQLAKQKQDQAKVTAIITKLEGPTQSDVGQFNQEVQQFAQALEELLKDSQVSTETKTKVEAGSKTVQDQLAGKMGQEQIATIVNWVKKYQSDPKFTLTEIEKRVKQEIETPLANLKQQLTKLEADYDPVKLRQQETVHRHQLIEQFRTQVDQLSNQIQTTYNQLLELRKTKLGTTPDERYFGDVAKAVNDLITNLGTLHNDILELKAIIVSVTEVSDEQKKHLEDLQTRSKTAIEKSTLYTNNESLEKLLGQQAVALIKPLEGSITTLQNIIGQIEAVQTEFTGKLGFTDEMAVELTNASSNAGKTLDGAKAFISQAKVDPKKIADFEKQLEVHQSAVEAMIKTIEPLINRQQLETKVEANLKQLLQKQQEELAARKEQTEQLKNNFEARIASIIAMAATLGAKLRTALEYAEQLKKYDPERGLEYYQLLEQLLTGEPLTLLGGSSLGKFVLQANANRDESQKLLMGTVSVLKEPEAIFQFDGKLTSLETSLGDESLLAKTINYMELYNSQHTLATYQSKQKEQLARQLEEISKRKDAEVIKVGNEIEADSKLKLNLIPDEAHKWLQSYETKKQQHQNQVSLLNIVKEQMAKLPVLDNNQIENLTTEITKTLEQLGEKLPPKTINGDLEKRLNEISSALTKLMASSISTAAPVTSLPNNAIQAMSSSAQNQTIPINVTNKKSTNNQT